MRIIDHLKYLWNDKRTLFGRDADAPSEYSMLDVPFELAALPFEAIAALARCRRTRTRVPSSVEQPARVVYVERPAPQPEPKRSPADAMRELEEDRRAKVTAAQGIADPAIRTRSLAMIEIDYRKRLAQLVAGAPAGTSERQEDDGMEHGTGGAPETRARARKPQSYL